jgi:hypothetical protein
MKCVFVLALAGVSVLSADSLPAVKTACGADGVKFSVHAVQGPPAIPDAEPGKAMIFVIEDFERPANEIGRPTMRVGLDGDWVGANRGSSYLYFAVNPGKHHLCVNWQSPPPWQHTVTMGASSLTADAGGTYYFRARLHRYAGLLRTRFRGGQC